MTNSTKKRHRILVVAPLSEEWRWLEDYFGPEVCSWTFLTGERYQRGRKGALALGWRAAWAARRHDVVATHGPWIVLFTAVFMRLLGCRRPILAFTFNHGNGIFFSGPFRRLARFALPHVSMFVTHSTYEREIYSKAYNIPPEKIAFTHWAVAAPLRKNDVVPYLPPDEPFVCCIGRNNRNLPLFLEAVEQAGVHAVLICRKGQAEGLPIPEKVILREDVSQAECDEVLARASACVVPLRDDSTGAGHMTLVTALHFGTPIVAPRRRVLEDYVIDGVTGLVPEDDSAQALAATLLRVLADETEGGKLRTSSATFAAEHLSEESAARFLSSVLATVGDQIETT